MVCRINWGLKYVESIGFFLRAAPYAKRIPGFPKAIFVVVDLAGFFRSYEFEQQRMLVLLDLSIRTEFARYGPLKFFLRLHKIRHQREME